MRELVIGTRGSALALWQAHAVQRMLKDHHPGLEVEITIINTTGDRILDTALSRIGDRALFTKELEQALIERSIDLAVHSLKDMPTRLPDGLTIGAVPPRHAPEDALVAQAGTTLESLPEGATVATSSLRRKAQLLKLRPDLNVVDVRGNVPTRLRKRHENGWEGMVLARAGLERLELEHEIAQIIPAALMLPAVGQGALAIEIRADDADLLSMLSPIEHAETRQCVTAERALLRALEGGCQVPIGAHARVVEQVIYLEALIASLDGSEAVRDSMSGPIADAERIGKELAERMLEGGGEEILAGVRDFPHPAEDRRPLPGER